MEGRLSEGMKRGEKGDRGQKWEIRMAINKGRRERRKRKIKDTSVGWSCVRVVLKNEE